MKQREEDEQEAQLFLDAVRDVKRIEHEVPEAMSMTLPTSAARPGLVRPHDGLASEATNETTFVRSGVQISVLRKLRRGTIPIEDEIDLHGYSTSEAEMKLHAFLLKRGPDRQRAVRVIHGKGLRSPNGKSVLRHKTQQWLRQCNAVLAFCPAPLTHGGTGALHVLLRKK
jgi:DNA-nicking Smr family endonuclease